MNLNSISMSNGGGGTVFLRAGVIMTIKLTASTAATLSDVVPFIPAVGQIAIASPNTLSAQVLVTCSGGGTCATMAAKTFTSETFTVYI
jgi:hypothetical protein